jgi:phosphoserine phosphatase
MAFRLSALVLMLCPAGCVNVEGPSRIPAPQEFAALAPAAAGALRDGGPVAPLGNLGAVGGRLGPWMAIAETIGKDMFLGSRAGVLLAARDVLVRPGEPAVLTAVLRGERLRGLPGHTLAFSVEGRPVGEAVTDAEGVAITTHRFPRAGTYTVRVRWKAGPFDLSFLESAPLLAAVRPAAAKMIVVDLDGTVVESHLISAMLSPDGGKPVPGAAETLTRLTDRGWEVVYLTARWEQLHVRNRRWLDDHGFPHGPVLEGRGGGDLAGGDEKRETLRVLRQKFVNLAAGVGDKATDAEACAAAGLAPYLLTRPRWDKPKKLRELADEIRACPAGTQVVEDWAQVEAGLTTGRVFDRAAMLRRLAAAGG